MSAPAGERSYSPFLGLIILTLSLAVWFGYHLAILQEEKKATLVALSRILPQSRQAVEAQKRFLALVEDVRQTALSDPKANQVLTDFSLQRASTAPPTTSSP